MLNTAKNKFCTNLIFIGLLFFANSSWAQSFEDGVSTNDIIREVEKTLLFSDDELSKMQITQNQLNQKSDFTIDSGKKENAIDIKVAETKKKFDIDIRSKERMAYNSTLSGQYEVAIELYKQVVAAEPQNNYALFSLATIYHKIGQLNQAKAIYYKLLQNNPENKEEIISNILSTLAEESPRDSLYLLKKLSASHPNSPYILVQTAFAFSNIKDYKSAAETLLKAIAFDPEHLEYKYNLAIIYDKAKDYEKALSAYVDVIQEYNNKWADIIPVQAVQLRIDTIKNKI